MMEESRKNDYKDGKIRMDLLPWRELEEVAKVYTAGAKKYGENKWQSLPNGYERYKGALLRHLCEIEKGNVYDEETGCLHCAQLVWNAIAMLHFKMEENKGGGFGKEDISVENVSICCPSCHSSDGIYVRNAETGLVQCRHCLTAFYIKEDGESENKED